MHERHGSTAASLSPAACRPPLAQVNAVPELCIVVLILYLSTFLAFAYVWLLVRGYLSVFLMRLLEVTTEVISLRAAAAALLS